MKTYSPSKSAFNAARYMEPVVPRLVELGQRGHADRNWYRDATRSIETVCSHYGYNVERFTAALSALSPRVAVRRNVALLEQLTRFDPFGDCPPVVGLGESWRKAWGFWTGERSVSDFVAIGQYLNKPQGMKTGSFAANLLGDEFAVTIDVWMARAFEVEPEKVFGSRPLYWACSTLVRQASIELKMTPAQAQAAIWHGIAWESGRLTMGSFDGLLREYFSPAF